MVVMDQSVVMFVIAAHVGGRMEIIHKNVSNVSVHFEFQMIFKHEWKGSTLKDASYKIEVWPDYMFFLQ